MPVPTGRTCPSAAPVHRVWPHIYDETRCDGYGPAPLQQLTDPQDGPDTLQQSTGTPPPQNNDPGSLRTCPSRRSRLWRNAKEYGNVILRRLQDRDTTEGTSVGPFDHGVGRNIGASGGKHRD